MPAQVTLDVYRGDTYHWTFTLLTDASTPYDLTGMTAKAEVRAKSGGDVLAVLACAITLPNIVDVRLSSIESGKLTAKAMWDLQLSTSGTPPEVTTVAAGPVNVTLDITDSIPTGSRRQP